MSWVQIKLLACQVGHEIVALCVYSYKISVRLDLVSMATGNLSIFISREVEV